MKKIFKYQMPEGGTRQFEMPKDAKILTAQVQMGFKRDGRGIQHEAEVTTLWALVDDEQPMEMRTFTMICTGDEAHMLNNEDIACKYIATLQFDKGQYVEHMFELFTIPQALKAANELLSQITPKE